MSDSPLTLVAESVGDASATGSRGEPDTSLVGLAMMARCHNIAADADQLAHDFRESGRDLNVPQLLLAGELAKFDFTWFISAVVKYRKLLGQVLLVSFVLQLLALVTLFEVTLSSVRSYVFAQTTSRIDIELGALLFRQPCSNLPCAPSAVSSPRGRR